METCSTFRLHDLKEQQTTNWILHVYTLYMQVCNSLFTCIIQKHQCTLIINLYSVYNLTICTIVTCFNYQKMRNLKSGLDHSEILLSSEKHILDNSFTLKKIYGKLYKSCPIYQERCFTAFLKLLWRKTQFCFCTLANTCI